MGRRVDTNNSSRRRLLSTGANLNLRFLVESSYQLAHLLVDEQGENALIASSAKSKARDLRASFT